MYRSYMNTNYSFLLVLLIGSLCTSMNAQGDSEIYALSIETVDGKRSFGIPVNLSNNLGYDNQPSFFDESTLLFSSSRNEQTDIALYSFNDNGKTWLSSTKQGSEYSPLLIPNDRAVSAIRLDTTGLQRLYRYPLSGTIPHPLFQKAKIAYHVWIDAHQLVATVLVENQMDLVLANTKNERIKTVYKNVGRSLHRIPNSSKVSFVQTMQGKSTVYAIDPLNSKLEVLISFAHPITDMYWFSDRLFLYSVGDLINEVDVVTSNEKIFYQSQSSSVSTITRILVSPDKAKLIFVGE